MARVTSKRQVTIPKAIADRYDIAAGDEIAFVPAGDSILVGKTNNAEGARGDREERLRRFDEATERQRARQANRPPSAADRRGWRREELYERGRAR